jgi:hypothetical protein
MKQLSATFAALTVAALTAAVALPAAAATGASSGGTSATPPPSEQPADPQAPTQDSDYQPAKATWYGPGFYGSRTACGSVLTRRTLGVAHKKLPCGTKVALRFEGRTVVVPVIDRGPYSRGIDYDLTYATARKLGLNKTSRLAAAALHG